MPLLMEKHLEVIAKSYDRHFVEYGKKDAPSYDNLPDYITGNPDYLYRIKENESDWEEVRRKKLYDFLSPARGMNFIHLGCSLGLRFKGYDKWPSKDAVICLCRGAAELLAEKNIHVNCINPGCNDTGYCFGETYEAIAKSHPAGRWGTPDDTADLALFLHSSYAKWITGQVIASHGGCKGEF